MMSSSALAKSIDHALLQPMQCDREFDAGCDVAKRWAVAAVCVKSTDVERARARLQDSDVAICAVVGFPHANASTDIICLEAKRALDGGATEIDAVVSLSRILSDDWSAVSRQIESYNRMAAGAGGILKVIFETGLIRSRDQKIKLCEICRELGVAYVKTSTGFAIGTRRDGSMTTSGATVDDVALLVQHAGPTCKVKASGGIRSHQDAMSFLQAGATRLGTASTERILLEAATSNPVS